MASEQEVGKLVIRLVAEINELKKGLNEAKTVIKDLSDSTKRSSSEAESSFAGIKMSYLKMTAVIYGAYRSLLKAMDFATIGARAQQVEQSFDNLTKSLSVDGKRLVEEMKRISGVWVDQTNVMIKAQRLLAEGLSPDEILKLTQASVVAAKMMGIDISEAFDRVTEAVLTLRTKGLKAAFPMDVQQITEKYAQSLGTVSKYLNEAGQRQAILNEIVKQAEEKQRMLGDAIYPNNYDKLQKLYSALDQVKEIMGKGLADAIIYTVDVMGIFVDQIEKIITLLRGNKKELTEIVDIEKELASSRGTIPMKQPLLLKSHGEAYENEKKLLQRDEERRKKTLIDEKRLQDDLTKFRLSNEIERIASINNIEKVQLEAKRNREIAIRKKEGKDTVAFELEWERKLAEADYRAFVKLLNIKREAEIENARQSGMSVAEIRKKFDVLNLEAREKYHAQLAEIDAKAMLTYEGLYGLSETELKDRLAMSKLLYEGYLDDIRRSANAEEAAKERINQLIIKNQIDEDQYLITKEKRLKNEIQLVSQLLDYAQKRLSYLSEEDDQYVNAYQEVENYRNKLRELTYELERQQASVNVLIERGLKQYSRHIKDELLYSFENLIPQAINHLSDSFKGLINDFAKGTKSASDAFKDFAKNLGQSVMDMIIDIGLLIAKMELLKALNIDTGQKGSTGGKGNWGNWLMNIIGLIGGLFQSGGQVKGKSGIDNVPIRATAGEYIHPVSSVQYYGLDIMEKLRAKMIPKEILLAMTSNIPKPRRLEPSLFMQTGGVVPVVKNDDKKTEITLINVVDQREMDAWAASSRGQNAIINVISSRADTVKRILQ